MLIRAWASIRDFTEVFIFKTLNFAYPKLLSCVIFFMFPGFRGSVIIELHQHANRMKMLENTCCILYEPE